MSLFFTGNAPTRNNDTDAGLDIVANADFWLEAGCSKLVPTGTAMAIPEGFVGLIWPRSGLSAKHSIETGAGVIDAGYRGEIKVKLYNHGYESYLIRKGDRIAQILIMPVVLSTPVKVDVLPEAARGDAGFGDSGK